MITFNNIPNTLRVPGVYNEIDNSRALQGLVQNPHKVLILGQKISSGSAETDALKTISKEGLADGYFGPGSLLARMSNSFKKVNEYTDLYALALSDNPSGTLASATVRFSVFLSNTGYSLSGDGTLCLRVAGRKKHTALYSGWSTADLNSAVQTNINTDSTMPVIGSTNATSALNFVAVQKGTLGNHIDIRVNYGAGEENPKGFDTSVLFTDVLSAMEGGANDPDVSDAWAIIEGEQFDHILVPYCDSDNLKSVDEELENRFGPMVDLMGHAYVVYPGAYASVGAFGNSNNSPFLTAMGVNGSPTPPEEWGAEFIGISSYFLNQDPARPLHYLAFSSDIVPPVIEDRFSVTERNNLLYDGISTFIVDDTGKVRLERVITTYKNNALGLPDPSYLNIQTLFTLKEIRYQYKVRMVNRFMIPRFKLADDTFPTQPGSYVATPSTIKQEIIALFTLLRDSGLIENMEQFVENLVVQRNTTDRDRVDVLIPPDLINQFRILASLIQFIL